MLFYLSGVFATVIICGVLLIILSIKKGHELPRHIMILFVIMYVVVCVWSTGLELNGVTRMNYWTAQLDIPKEPIFRTPEEAFYYSNPDTHIFKIIETDNCAFILYSEPNNETGYSASADKNQGLWIAEPLKTNIARNSKFIGNGEYIWSIIQNNTCGEVLHIVNQVGGISEKGNFKVEDTIGSVFERIVYPKNYGFTSGYCTVVSKYTKDYAIILNGNKI